MGIHWARELLDQNKNISADVLDLRTLLPWDKEAVKKTVQKTNRVMVLHEDSLTGGIGAEIVAWISEYCFEYLDAPVMREGSLDTPIPFSKELEENYLPKRRFEDKLKALVRF
jgi:2-oxoisovalerate dehydrogenase E1 component